MLGDDAIDGTGVSRIDGPQHLARALASLRRDARVGRDTPSPDGDPETRQSGQPVGSQVVQGNDGGERFVSSPLGQADVEGLAAQAKLDNVVFKRRVTAQRVSGEMKAVGWRGTGFEQDRRRVGLLGPEDRLDKGCGLRVGGEIATPIAVRTPEPSPISAGRWPRVRRRIVYIRDCGARIPRRDRPASRYRCSRKRLATASCQSRPSSPASRKMM